MKQKHSWNYHLHVEKDAKKEKKKTCNNIEQKNRIEKRSNI